MAKIDVVDEKGVYLYSWMFEVSGENLELMNGKEIGSMAGEPRRISVFMDYPNLVVSNPSKKLLKNKRYKVIVVESELVE
jgi:hypothetical protein